MVGDKAHRLEMRVSHVCDWNTCRQSFDGSGEVLRGMKGDLDSNSIFIDYMEKYKTKIIFFKKIIPLIDKWKIRGISI